MARIQALGSAVYTVLLFAPFGFWILGLVFAIKALKSRDLSQFKKDVKDMFYYKSSQT